MNQVGEKKFTPDSGRCQDFGKIIHGIFRKKSFGSLPGILVGMFRLVAYDWGVVAYDWESRKTTTAVEVVGPWKKRWQFPTNKTVLPETNSKWKPLKIGQKTPPKVKKQYSNHPFSGANLLLVSGRVKLNSGSQRFCICASCPAMRMQFLSHRPPWGFPHSPRVEWKSTIPAVESQRGRWSLRLKSFREFLLKRPLVVSNYLEILRMPFECLILKHWHRDILITNHVSEIPVIMYHLSSIFAVSVEISSSWFIACDLEWQLLDLKLDRMCWAEMRLLRIKYRRSKNTSKGPKTF